MTDTARPFCPPDTPPVWTRPRGFRIAHVDLAVRIDLERRRASGRVQHRVELLAHAGPQSTLVLDQHDLAIAAVAIDGRAAAFSVGAGSLAIALPEGVGAAFTVAIDFAAEQPAKGLYFIAADPLRGRVAMAWTQGAMEDHSHWFPCFDNPNNLSTWRFAIEHRPGLAAIANGVRAGSADVGDGWVATSYAQDLPHVAYLVNVVVGELVEVAQPGGAVPISHWLPRGHEDKALAMFRATPFAIGWIGDFVGMPFPWRRYGHVVVHGFMWGGMENTTLTTITDRMLMDGAAQAAEDIDCDSLVIHELVHQWFGDLLTMAAWSDIWLNESFATYLEARGTALWRARLRGADEAGELALELWNNRQDWLGEDRERYRRPLVTNRYVDPYELFDRVAYEKGSLVLHHLCMLLGEERFRAGLRLYVTRHAHGLVETADLRQALAEVTGEPLDWFFAQWVERAGHPRLKVRARHDPARGQLLVEIEQLQAGDDATLLFRLPTAVAWAGGDGVATRQAVELTRRLETVVLPCPTAPAWVALDPDGHLPAEWDEDGETGALLARAGAAALGVQARARAVGVLGGKHPTAPLVAGLAALAGDPAAPELVRAEALGALGRLRGGPSRDALLALWPRLADARLRRQAAKALGGFRADALVARSLVECADRETSLLVAGELLAARGALEHPGATPLLRARMARPSWNQRLRAGCMRGLGDSGEIPALDELLAVVGEPSEHEAVRAAAAAGAAALGARHLLLRGRARRALEILLEDESLALRAAAARALARLGDPEAAGAVAAQLARERFGNVRRILRETGEALAKAAAVTTATAELARRIDDLERERKAMAARVEALEKRLDAD